MNFVVSSASELVSTLIKNRKTRIFLISQTIQIGGIHEKNIVAFPLRELFAEKVRKTYQSSQVEHMVSRQRFSTNRAVTTNLTCKTLKRILINNCMLHDLFDSQLEGLKISNMCPKLNTGSTAVQTSLAYQWCYHAGRLVQPVCVLFC